MFQYDWNTQCSENIIKWKIRPRISFNRIIQRLLHKFCLHRDSFGSSSVNQQIARLVPDNSAAFQNSKLSAQLAWSACGFQMSHCNEQPGENCKFDPPSKRKQLKICTIVDPTKLLERNVS